MVQVREGEALERHRAQCRANNKARYRAIKQLVAEQQQRYDELYTLCAMDEGVDPVSVRRRARARQDGEPGAE